MLFSTSLYVKEVITSVSEKLSAIRKLSPTESSVKLQVCSSCGLTWLGGCLLDLTKRWIL